ncbi:MAG TPA: NnrU family protein [Burkholderiaceae bacterium]|nr:NnrU family protein [Burkholderiaceae bacterium]
MWALILGLILFLGVHSVRIVADDWRSAQVARMGLNAWKGLYSLISIVGLVLIVWGYGLTRTNPVDLWQPPPGMRHMASLLTLAGFVLIVAAYVPRSRIRALVGHPMLLGVALWALAHLLSNGRLADLVLFGAFLVWALVGFASARRRDRVAGTPRGAGALVNDLTTIVVGVVAWFVFALYLHGPLIGVRPFG